MNSDAEQEKIKKNVEETEELEVIPDSESDLSEFRNKLVRVKEEFKKCESERKEYLEGWQRTKADHINYKNEESKRFEDLAQFITMGLVQEILPVLDSFNLALGHGLSPELERGVLLIRSQLEDVLKKRGLENIQVKKGEEFNPAKHESVGDEESDEPLGAIVEEIQKGYLFRGRVLRPARVKISRGRNN